MATDKGGQQGPRSTRDTTTSSAAPVSRYRQPERNDRDVSNIGVSPAVPGFGFQFPAMPNGMPMLPPGFVIPGTIAAQPPPPGAN
jgi:protein NRD1